MSESLRASVVVIGDEILDGFVRDSNAAWLAGHLHELGIPLDRISVVPDQQPAIVEALAAEFARSRPRVVFTSGGIGTTPDDRTMAAVAAFLEVDLVDEPTLRAMVDRILARLHEQGHDVGDAQRAALGRMARAPRGAIAVTGDAARAPSARVDIDGGPAGEGVALIVLPGVPDQFRDLVTHLDATLLADLGSPTHTEQLRHPYPESVLTPLLEDLEHRRPDVRIGSYPGPECVLRVHGAPDAVRAVIGELRETIEALGRDPAMRRLAEQWTQGWRSASDRPAVDGSRNSADHAIGPSDG